MTSCPHGMPSPGSCVDCMAEGNLPPAPRPKGPEPVGSRFVSRYDGNCSGCSFYITAGELIVRMSDDTYRHADRGCV